MKVYLVYIGDPSDTSFWSCGVACKDLDSVRVEFEESRSYFEDRDLDIEEVLAQLAANPNGIESEEDIYDFFYAVSLVEVT